MACWVNFPMVDREVIEVFRSSMVTISLSALITTIPLITRISNSNHGCRKTISVPRLGSQSHSLFNARWLLNSGIHGSLMQRPETGRHLCTCNCNHSGGDVFLLSL